MADLAKIGFAADSSGLVAAEQALNRLTPAARKTEDAAAGAAGAIGAASAAAAGLVTATSNVVRTTNAANGSFNTAAANVNKVNDAYKKLADTQKRINDITGVSNSSDTKARAADIAAYGQELDKLRGKFNPLFAAGQQYKETLNEINYAYKVGAISQKEQAAAIEATKKGFTNQVNAIKGVRTATNGLSYEAKNLSFQLVDVSQGLLSGISPMQIFAQQAGQIGQVVATSGKGASGLFKEIGSAIASVLTPTRLLVLGVLGIAAAFTYFTFSVINGTKALDDLARATDQSLTRIHQLQQLTAGKGISDDEFASGMKAFADQVYLAKQNTGDLNSLMIANGKTAKTNEQYFAAVADLVMNATSNMQKQKILQEAGLPTSQSWVRLMEQGGKKITEAANATVGFNEQAERNLVAKARAFDDAWNSSMIKFKNNFKSALVDVMGWIDSLNKSTMIIAAGIGAALAVALAPFSLLAAALVGIAAAITAAIAAGKSANSALDDKGQPLKRILVNKPDDPASGSGKASKTKEELLTANSQAQQRIALLGELATVEDQVRQKQLELTAANLNGISVGEKQTAAIINATRANAEMTRVNAQAQIGIFNMSKAQQAATDTLQMWIDKGLVDKTNTEQMAAAQLVLSRNIKATADAAAVAAAPLQQLKQLELDSSNLSKVLDTGLTGALSGLVSPIQDVLNGVTGLSQGFKNTGIVVLKAIQEMIIKMLILAPIAKGLQSIFGGFLGGSGITLGTSSGPTPFSAKGNIFGTPQKFANGGAFTNSIVNKPTMFGYGGAFVGMMGEAGPEAVMPLRRGPGGSLGVQMFGGGGSNDNSSTNYSPVFAPVYHIGGNVTQDDLAKVRKEQAEDRKKFTAQTARSIAEIRKRGGNV